MTILEENDYYLVIYYGKIFGAVRRKGDAWIQVADEEIEAGHLPRYEPGQPGERVEISWSSELVNQIGTQIAAHLAV